MERFTYLLTKHEIRLLFRASANNIAGIHKLQKDIFKAGRNFMRRFRLQTK